MRTCDRRTKISKQLPEILEIDHFDQKSRFFVIYSPLKKFNYLVINNTLWTEKHRLKNFGKLIKACDFSTPKKKDFSQVLYKH